jgi:hypothetical protein
VGLLRILPVMGLIVGAWGTCDQAHGPAQPTPPLAGTWGGDNAGLIATDSSAHVHIGCTAGDVAGPLQVGTDGRFNVAGRYNITLYAVARGPDHPARFSGQIEGIVMTLTVTLTDTAVTLGPVQLTLGKEPRMGPCPICRRPTPH